MTTFRYYQSEAIAAVHDYWAAGGGNPLIDLATGTGKSVVLAQIIQDVVTQYDARVIVLTHVKELVEQDLRATLRLWPSCPAGINSAGLGRRDTRAQVLFASIQSVHRMGPEQLGARHLVIIDEAHLVPREGDGMYLSFINRMREGCPDLRVLGLTATPYRLGSGRLDQGEARIFDEIVYDYGIGQGVKDGFLSPLTARAGSSEIDVSQVKRAGGEFVVSSLASAATSITEMACREIFEKGQDRKGWIVFGSGVDHAQQVADQLRGMGIATACVTGDTDKGDRDQSIRAFKAQQLRCLTSVGVLTTGFDAPHVDLIAMLRPTLSTGLYVQMLGRGTRIAEGKDNCLVLDFSGNVRRHGPVDAIEVRGGKGASAKDETAVKVETVRAKACPSCGELVHIRTMKCTSCDYAWPVEEKHEAKADTRAAVMVRDVEEDWHTVTDISVRPHRNIEKNTLTLRVDYYIGLQSHCEWICLDHTGFAQEKAKAWWRLMTGEDLYPDVERAADQIKDGETVVNCTAIKIRRDGKYWRVVDRMRSGGTSVFDTKSGYGVRKVERQKETA